MDSELTGDLGSNNIILPNIIYSGVPSGYDCLVLSDLVRSSGSAIFVLKDDKRIATTIAGMEFFSPDINVIEFPAWDCLPYDRSSPKNDIISKRVATLVELSKAQQKRASIILISISAFLQRVPSVKYCTNRELLLVKGEEVSRDKLEHYLVHNGYRRVATVFEPGDFCIRGNIVDILYAPLTAGEITLATNFAACTRSIMIALVSIIVFYYLVDLQFYNFLNLGYFSSLNRSFLIFFQK